ncbi:MAG: ShlB/FhaC/HecB family hemolysin secretion/activation protein [Symploca sp. SIO2G7]|nr:ShlB/FhaC/HecB family hemolysin secretion/activation protein [Symploca sp. SIO2G7]
MAKNLLVNLTSIGALLTTLSLKIPATATTVPSSKQYGVTPEHLAGDGVSQIKKAPSVELNPENILTNSHPLELSQLPVPLPNNNQLKQLSTPPLPPDTFQQSPSQPPKPELPQPLPPPEELLGPSDSTPEGPEVPEEFIPGEIKITIKRFEFSGNTAFSDQELAQEVKEFTNRPITFAELLSARTKITELYTNNGYVTSGALIPPQSLTDPTITIQIVEGGLEDIEVNGTRRLLPKYVRSRLEIATAKPLNVNKLLEALQVLQLDPLIDNISAELSTGSGPATSLLIVEVTEANTWLYEVFANNGRSPSVGSFRRGFTIGQANFLGVGDRLTFGYTNTDGSNEIDTSYTIPFNPRNGTLSLSYGDTSSKVIEPPFDILDIKSSSRNFDITIRQPIVQTPTQEFALSLTGSRRETDNSLLGIPFPLSEGADEQGRTRVSSLGFAQEWTKRSAEEVLALRSQFNIGIGAFDATLNDPDPGTGEPIPDSRFFSWRGQGQWVKLLAPDTVLLIRGDMQLATTPLLPIEQFGLGGLSSVRGYRQFSVLTDNGAFASAEIRLPILRIGSESLLQLAPFIDVGTTWNTDRANPDPNSLASVGLGFELQLGDSFNARLDWGIPLIPVDNTRRTWQENGLHFSVTFSNF